MLFIRLGDYYIPDLILDDQPDKPLGRYGQMRQKFLEEHHPCIRQGENLTLYNIHLRKTASEIR